MASQIINSFSQFSLTPEEQTAGELLTTTQVQVIRNLLAGEALKRIALTFDPTQPMQFAQAEAEIQGAIGAYTYLLEASEIAHGNLVSSALEESETSQTDHEFMINSDESVTERIFT